MKKQSSESYVCETITWFRLGGWVVRVFRKETSFKTGPDNEIIEVLSTIQRNGYGYLAKDIVKALMKLSRIFTIELTYKDGDGVSYRPEHVGQKL